MSTMNRTIMLMAGGTGGHVIPALAVARQLRDRGFNTVWLGTRAGIEARLVPAAGIDIEWIPVSGLRGKGRLALLAAPFKLVRAVWSANRAFGRHRPVAVLGMGGFASGPGGLVAWLRRVPLVLHEQNSIAGMTNRILARFTDRVLAAFPGAFPASVNAEVVGNPVRDDVCALPRPSERFARRDGSLRILVLGGSQGARSLNETVPAALAESGLDVTVRHQCGRQDASDVEARYAAGNISVTVEPFIDDMADAYAWADVAICRAGAMTVFELAAAGLGAILVPFPHAVDDHQTGNANYLAANDAAIVMQERDMNVASLASALQDIGERNALQAMAERARERAMPEATEQVTARCIEAAGGAA